MQQRNLWTVFSVLVMVAAVACGGGDAAMQQRNLWTVFSVLVMVAAVACGGATRLRRLRRLRRRSTRPAPAISPAW